MTLHEEIWREITYVLCIAIILIWGIMAIDIQHRWNNHDRMQRELPHEITIHDGFSKAVYGGA